MEQNLDIRNQNQGVVPGQGARAATAAKVNASCVSCKGRILSKIQTRNINLQLSIDVTMIRREVSPAELGI